MRKIIFLTFVMILGVSSVSFGKQYLCETKLSYQIHLSLSELFGIKGEGDKYIINTQEDNIKLESVKSINKDSNYYICGSEEQMDSNRGKSWRLENKKFEFVKSLNPFTKRRTLLCRQLKKIEYGGHVSREFIFEEVDNAYIFTNFGNHLNIFTSVLKKGVCQEI